jgi:CDP-diacylglycerol--glycerol-3-phosphate 3-phosphatidyltransferase
MNIINISNINIANIITISGLIIVTLSLFFYYKTKNYIFLILALVGFTCDYFDGYIARKYNITSKLGNVLDKLTDKINQIGILLILTLMYDISPIYLFLYIIREIIMLVMRKLKMKSVSSSFYGKLKTFLFPLLLILFHFNFNIKYIYLNLLTVFNFITLLI